MAESDAAADTFQCGSCGEVFHDLGLLEEHKEGDPCTVVQAARKNRPDVVKKLIEAGKSIHD